MAVYGLRLVSICISIVSLLSQYTNISHAYHATQIPPLLDVPVYSLSTLGDDHHKRESSSTATTIHHGVASSTMNILTYASPVSISPHRMWCISLYKGTLSHENFSRERRGVLQLLRPAHAPRRCNAEETDERGGAGDLIRVLGGSSGRDVNKREACANLGYAWEKLYLGGGDDSEEEDASWPQVLPSCLYYLKLELVGELIDCGSHEVALCKVIAMLSGDEMSGDRELDLLSTRELRRESIISELGRVI